ncbi:hypothetical protein [Gottfriedia acidiceleris]|uniref:hypothetical protein n=1 Tax=Gottfriedia acidiceleris TaxID=371036 RepID=UPI003D2622F4
MKVWKIWLTFVLIIVTFIGSIFCFFYFIITGTPPWGKVYQKISMRSYLEKKYNTEFTIHEVGFNPLNEVGYYATASPKANPDILFDLSVSVDELSGYADLYPVEFWQTKDAEPIKDYISNLFPQNELMSFGIYRKVDEEVSPNIPTLNTLHYDMGYSGVLSINLKGDWFKKTDEERKIQLDKINQLSSYIQKKNLPVLVWIYYATDDYYDRKVIYITQEGKVVDYPNN